MEFRDQKIYESPGNGNLCREVDGSLQRSKHLSRAVWVPQMRRLLLLLICTNKIQGGGRVWSGSTGLQILPCAVNSGLIPGTAHVSPEHRQERSLNTEPGVSPTTTACGANSTVHKRGEVHSSAREQCGRGRQCCHTAHSLKGATAHTPLKQTSRVSLS